MTDISFLDVLFLKAFEVSLRNSLKYDAQRHIIKAFLSPVLRGNSSNDSRLPSAV